MWRCRFSLAVESPYESLAELRREDRIGDSVLLITVHGAKGMEFDHVFLLEGDWLMGGAGRQTEEEERRIFYVGMISLVTPGACTPPNPSPDCIRIRFSSQA
jgi:superfamily I DNA/RNA helicase